jgi:hypothetical protein
MAGFLGVTIVGLIAVAVLWVLMPETKSSALQQRPESVDLNAVASDGVP